MNPLEVVVQVENRGTSPVFLKERFLYALPGQYGLVIKLDAHEIKVFSAQKFFRRNKLFRRPSIIEVHDVNGKLVQRVTPQTFMIFPKIIIYETPDEKGGSIILGIRPGRALELSRLRAFTFLAMGYKGRDEVPVAKEYSQ
uniref:Uncharacterized protein n=1 Tax=Nicotiana tabacum TaxID=4097 RepID=A0A1S4ARX0_TOBAC|nr:PREDICTED: uncharacterized protein LOC107800717 [Nicotiana tabacum]